VDEVRFETGREWAMRHRKAARAGRRRAALAASLSVLALSAGTVTAATVVKDTTAGRRAATDPTAQGGRSGTTGGTPAGFGTAQPWTATPGSGPTVTATSYPASPVGQGPAGARAVPGDLLDLTNWKLTLPIGGAHKPTEVTQPALRRYSVSPYFHVDPTGSGVVFQANAGGVTTSNSGYPRSELREMMAGGNDEASWSTTSGTHAMSVQLAITHLTAAKPQVTVAQIHDDADDVLVVRLDGPGHLYVEHNGDDYGDMDTAYRLGSVFTVEFTVASGHIRISYNGVPKVDYAKSSGGDYFKAGCYTQSNTSKGDAPDSYAQVIIYHLTVTHSV
jgi:poly(beta-D-mannuronate) lyase